MELKHILILQNKIDLISQDQARTQYEQILGFVKGNKCPLYQLSLIVLVQRHRR